MSLTCNFFTYFKFHSDWGLVIGKIKQNELDPRDTAPLKMRPEKRKESELRNFRVNIKEINKFATHEFLIVFRGETLYTSLVTLNEVRRL